MRKEIIGNATLYLGDCLEVLPTLDKVDAVITDPPYGIDGSSGTDNLKRGKGNYSNYEDTQKNIALVVIPAINRCLSISERAAITPGFHNVQKYPQYEVLGGFYSPAAASRCRWGFCILTPILFYGKDPRLGKNASGIVHKMNGRASTDLHPCAKPIDAIEWLVDKTSLNNETILDPFMGSGTTGVACMNLGRKFIGIEIEQKYFDIACERIDQAQKQQRLFA